MVVSPFLRSMSLLTVLFVFLPFCVSKCQVEPTDTDFKALIAKCPNEYDFEAPNNDFVWDLSHLNQGEFENIFGDQKKYFFGGKLMIVDSELEAIDLISRFYVEKIEIRRNKKLKSIGEAKYLHKLFYKCQLRSFNFNVTGNPLLDEEVIKKIKSECRSDVQDVGECEFITPVKDMQELNPCKYVRGDLIIHNAVDNGDRPSGGLSKITGCLRITDTELDELGFLMQNSASAHIQCADGTTSEISGNKNLWLQPSERKEVEQLYGSILIENDYGYVGDINCDPAQFFSSDRDCNKVTGTLTFDDKTGDMHNLQYLRKVNGTIVIQNFPQKTLEFTELRKIFNDNPGPAISIIDNPQLDSIDFQLINTITTKDDVAIHIKGRIPIFLNEDFRITTSALEIECDLEGKEVTELEKLNVCTMIKGDLVLNKATGTTLAKIHSISGCLRVVDTELDNLDFLDRLDPKKPSSCSGKSEIKGNKKLCLTWRQKKDLEGKFGKPIEYTAADESCGLECNEAEFEDSNSQCLILTGDLTITGLKSGSITKQIFNKVKKIEGKLTIKGNEDVSIDFVQLETVGNSNFDEAAIVVEGDNKLKSLAFPKLNKVSTNGAVAISVKGFDMPKDQAKFFTQIADQKRFLLECRFKSPVAKMSDLDYCTSINGDLLLHKATGTTNGKLEWIGGCIQVKDTELKSLDFLKISKPSNSVNCSSVQGVSEIKGNAELCPEWPEIKNLLNGFGQPIEISIDDKCDLPCEVREFMEDGSYCRQMTHEFLIDFSFEPNDLQKVIHKVRNIQGTLRIRYSNLSHIEFPHLVSIEVKQQDFALNIHDNHRLKTLSFPKLKSMETAYDTAVFITQNDGFRLSKETFDVIQKAVKDKPFYYECHETSEITSFSRLEGCSEMSSGLHITSSFINGNPPSSPISYIRGCLNITDSPLNALEWLDLNGNACREEDVIKGNKDLCVYPLKERQLRVLSRNLTISGNKPREECPVYCKAVNGSIPDHECNVVEGDLRVENNCSSDPNLLFVKEIKGSLSISDCHLDSVKTLFPQLKKISAETGAALTLDNISGDYNVCELKELELESTGDVVLTIDTEKTIPFMDVADLKAKFGESKVAVKNEEKRGKGVCVFVSSAKEVKECERVEGDLLLDEKTKEVDDGLKEISGCLILNKADLKNYAFLAKVTKIGDSCRWRNGSSEISGISCIPYKVRRTVKGELKKEVEKEENRKGCYECVGGLTGAKCQVVIGDVIVNGTTSETKKRQLEEIKEIYGRLVIRGTTDVESIFFKSLETIEALNSSEPAIEVVENKKLKKLEMPLLKKPTSKGKTLVKIANNENLEMTESLRNTLKRITGEECTETKGAVCHFSKAPQKTTEEGASTGDEKDDEGGIGAVGISLIVVGVLLVVAAIAGVAVFFFIKKKKGEKTKEKKAEKKKGAKETKSKEKKKTKASKSKDVVSKSKETLPKSTLSKEQPSKQLASREMDPPSADPPAAPAVDAAPVDAAAAPSDPPPPALPSPDPPAAAPPADYENLVPDAPQPV